jgi:hypothetical protein
MALATPPARYGTLTLPDGRVIVCPRWAPSPEVLKAREDVLRNTFFLVNISGNNGLGELWRCKNCHGRHRYLTSGCIERPFSGLDGVLSVMWQQAGDLAAVRALGTDETGAARVGQMIAREVMKLPDLATSHPEMARRRAREQQLSAFDIEMAGLPIGTAEQIPKSYAQKLLDRINATRPSAGRLQIEGLI